MNTSIDKSQKPPVMHARGTVNTVGFPLLAEIKADGEFQMLTVTNGHAFLLNKYGRQRWDCPITDEALRALPKGTYLGELYWQVGAVGGC